MPLNLCDYEKRAHEAIKAFWQSRDDAKRKQQASGKADQGERAGVTGGKNLDGFVEASYLRRYDLFCQKLAKEQLYSSASVLATPRTAVSDGAYTELSQMTGLRSFVASLAGHIAAQAAR